MNDEINGRRRSLSIRQVASRSRTRVACQMFGRMQMPVPTGIVKARIVSMSGSPSFVEVVTIWMTGAVTPHHAQAPALVRNVIRLAQFGRHQGGQDRQEDARRQAAASTVGLQRQARVHHGTLHAGSQHTRAGCPERLRRPAGRAHSRRPGMVEPRSAYLVRQDIWSSFGSWLRTIPAWHPAIGLGSRQRATPMPARISRE